MQSSSVRIRVDEVGIPDWRYPFILSNTGYYQMTRKKRSVSVSEDVLRGSITTLKRKGCIGNPTMECSCGVCRTKKQRRSFKRPITAFVVLISQGPKFPDRIWRLGYYWPSMIKDCIDYALQFHGDYIHQAPEPLHPTVPSWSFEAWEMDVIGSPPSLPYAVPPLAACLPSLLHSPPLYLALIFLRCSCNQPSLTALERNKLN